MNKFRLNDAELNQLQVDIEQSLVELEEFERSCDWFSSQAIEGLEYWQARMGEDLKSDDGV